MPRRVLEWQKTHVGLSTRGPHFEPAGHGCTVACHKVVDGVAVGGVAAHSGNPTDKKKTTKKKSASVFTDFCLQQAQMTAQDKFCFDKDAYFLCLSFIQDGGLLHCHT